MLIDVDLVRSDPALTLTPHLMEEAEKGTLDLSRYVDLLVKDLVRDSNPFSQALSLVNEGNVALAKRFISEHVLNEREIVEFEEHCNKVSQNTNNLVLNVDKQITQLRDRLDPNILNKCLSLQLAWQKSIQQERYHIAQRELLTAQNLLADEKNFSPEQVPDQFVGQDGIPAKDILSGSVVDVIKQGLLYVEKSPAFTKESAKGPDETAPDEPDEAFSESTTEPAEGPDEGANVSPEPIVNLLNQAIRAWSETTLQISRPLRDLLRPTDKLPKIPSYVSVNQALRQVQHRRKKEQQEAKSALTKYFYLVDEDRRQLKHSFYQALIIYASERVKEHIRHKDFDSANQIYSDIIQLLGDHSNLHYSDQDIFSFYRDGTEACAAASAKNTNLSFSAFDKLLLQKIGDFPRYIGEARNKQILKQGKVLFFYYRVQAFREVQNFDNLIQFYIEYSVSIANLVEGNIELSRLYEVTKNHYDEALYRKAEHELTELELPTEMELENTLQFIKTLPPYQVVSALKRIKKRFAHELTDTTRSLMQMYDLVLILFDIQKPEELIFTGDRILKLISITKSGAKGTEYVQLIPESENLPLGVLDNLESFVQGTIAAVSVTDLALVRQHIVYALESLRKQREYLRNTGSATRYLWHTLSDHWISILVARQRAMSRQTSLQLTLHSEEILVNEWSSLVIYVKNVGPGIAQDIDIALTSSDLSIKEPAIVPIRILKHGDEDSLRFIVKPRVSGRQAEIRLLVRHFDADGNPVITSKEQALTFKNIGYKEFPASSPYVWGQPLKEGTKIFYGRRDVFDFLLTRFWGEERNKIIALQGERRMGKTSILHQLKTKKMFRNYRLVYFDFQARYANLNSIQAFLYHFARRITSEARLPRDLQVDRSQFRLGYGEDYDVFEAWLDRVEEKLEQRDTQIVIVFDEFEKLLGRRFEDNVNVNKRLVEELLQYLRSVMLVRERFNWIIAGSWSLIAKQRQYFSSLFGMALSYWVSYLSHDDAIALIQEPVQEYLTYDQAATERILRLTGGHPFHIQIMCDELFNRAREYNSHQITVDDVNKVVDHTLQQVTETNFRIVWTSLNNPVSRKVLAAVAEATQADSNTFVYKDEVFNFLRQKNPGQGEESFYAVLDVEDGELMQRELIETHPVDSERVRVRSELLHCWLRKAKPLVTVLREER